MAPQVGLEPTTRRLTVACSTIELLRNVNARGILACWATSLHVPVKGETDKTLEKVAAGPGFEPGLEDSKSTVLPLHNPASEKVPEVGLEPTRELPPNSF